VINETTRKALESTALSPQFYTTDYEAMDRMSVDSVRKEWDELMGVFAEDRNRAHFQRRQWDFDPSSISGELRREFIEFLVTALTSEFSGCVLYAELGKRAKNPDMKKLFKFMARDESRHAGLINECIRDFGMEVDMNFLVKAKQYKFFSPKFILYATYLSEKIGYARYIKVFRHLEKHPELRFHPIYDWFKEWCNDEFRHGEALALLMRAQPKLLSGLNLFWVRFFQIAVYATMFVRDHTRVAYHAALKIDPEAYGMDVFRLTTEISKQVFPVLVDVDHPAFLAALRRMVACSERIAAAKAKGGLGGFFASLAPKLGIALAFVRLLVLPVKTNELPRETLMAAAW
jgi:magnesium-protoporphyrin IX monomethyl ester (oxidative) cyclase